MHCDVLKREGLQESIVESKGDEKKMRSCLLRVEVDRFVTDPVDVFKHENSPG